LYFNLPPEIIKSGVPPKKLFGIDLKNAENAPGKKDSRNNFLNDMLNLFEQEKDGKNRVANIILLQVPHNP